MTKSSKSPEYVSWISLGLTLVFFCLTFYTGGQSRYPVVVFLSWQILSGALIWLILGLQFRLRSMAEREDLDMAHLKTSDASTIFHVGGDRAELMAVCKRRLDLFEKWFLPVFAVLSALYQGLMALYIWSRFNADPDGDPRNALVVAVAMTAIAFVSFLMSRYGTGMSVEASWKPLRSGGSMMLASAFLCFAMAIGMALTIQTDSVINILKYVIPILMATLAFETVANVILDIYRPRIQGQYNRAAFDSRLLGVINEPGGLFHSAAGAIDYQFGFKVSQTWFYKLLERAIVPLILFGTVTLYLASAFVVVNTGEQAVVEHFGNPLKPDGQPRLREPGFSMKWPWPIDRIYKYPTDRIQELYIGYRPTLDPNGMPQRGPLLWGKSHYEEEFNLLVATEDQDVQSEAEGAPPVSLVKANIPVHYKIKDLYNYLYGHTDSKAMLESICYQELTRFGASTNVEVDQADDSLFGGGRESARNILKQRIQTSADAHDLGVDIVLVGLQGIHPPEELAQDYQAVVGAIQTKQALILEAETQRNQNLSQLAGSVPEAYALYAQIQAYQASRQQGDESLEAKGEALDKAFIGAMGDIYKSLRESQAYAFDQVKTAEATGLRFAGQVQAYHAARDIYLRDLRLEALTEALQNVRKYAIVTDREDSQVTILDLQEQMMVDLYKDLLGASSQENSGQ
jgi:regulator of protease activity HflC (stomatin/prohibitin superfamily)